MKVIFLDIDGVLVTEDKFRRMHRHGVKQSGRHAPFDEFAVEKLNALTKATKARIVISSVWRIGWSLRKLRSICKSQGITGIVTGKTPIHRESGKIRGDEIAEWLTQHPKVTNYVILDDDGDMTKEQMPRFVQTHFKKGFAAQSKFIKALKILEGPSLDRT